MPKRISTKAERRPVWFRLRRMVNPDTGELQLALVAAHLADAQVLKERGYREGDEISAELHKDRNPKFWRLMHGLAKFVRDNTDEFAGLDVHATLKRLQLKADVECDVQETEIDIPGFGLHTALVRVPRSLSFSEMDDGTFRGVFRQIRDVCAREYFPDWHDMQVEEFEAILRGNQPP